MQDQYWCDFPCLKLRDLNSKAFFMWPTGATEAMNLATKSKNKKGTTFIARLQPKRLNARQLVIACSAGKRKLNLETCETILWTETFLDKLAAVRPVFVFIDNVCGTLNSRESNLICTIELIVLSYIILLQAIISLIMSAFTRNTENFSRNFKIAFGALYLVTKTFQFFLGLALEQF